MACCLCNPGLYDKKAEKGSLFKSRCDTSVSLRHPSVDVKAVYLPCAPTQPLVFCFFCFFRHPRSLPFASPLFFVSQRRNSFCLLVDPLDISRFCLVLSPLPTPSACARLSPIRLLLLPFYAYQLDFQGFSWAVRAALCSRHILHAMSYLTLPHLVDRDVFLSKHDIYRAFHFEPTSFRSYAALICIISFRMFHMKHSDLLCLATTMFAPSPPPRIAVSTFFFQVQ